MKRSFLNNKVVSSGLLCLALNLIFLSPAIAQKKQPTPTTAAAHSHNDYLQKFPFWLAYHEGFGSIEADVFLKEGKLMVAHTAGEIEKERTLETLYLKPLKKVIDQNNGRVYAGSSRILQLLIDLKTEAVPTLKALLDELSQYPSLTGSKTLHIVITGNRPPIESYKQYPSWLLFDGDLTSTYNPDALKKVALFSDNFARYSKWNGKGRLPEAEKLKLEAAISKAHAQQKKIRFWNAPDIVNSWYSYLDMGVDFINTDHIELLSQFLETLPNRYYVADATHVAYQPAYRNDGLDKPVKNLIILIGDGTGLAQWYAGYTANNQSLNVFNMMQIGLSKTSSYDNYITDSAPGATAISSGYKGNNRSVGVDHTGVARPSLTELVARQGWKTGIITSGDMRDATPAAFYGHRAERSNFPGMLQDLVNAPVDILAGAGAIQKDPAYTDLVKKFNVSTSLAGTGWSQTKPIIIADSIAAIRTSKGRKNWSLQVFEKSLQRLSKNKSGFLLMLEGAQIDHGGHANVLPDVVTELKDFDQIVGAAMRFADSNGETLVIVTGDHETGGLTLTAGDYNRNFISGQFSTGDHTAIPVPVFAYGPQSQLFRGVYENTAIFHKILKALSFDK
ncbi:alkaline phosphatase [Niabella yanshanensis]|uniref:Alkaline phosphatase n=1 Tax=Niabella yanshanensis TaxID=577386 RepID=A0ABZ0W9J2_9BACT|nr:alkaline phosphatase [Niabella yanshanensis]WQD39162.1 alkaline phosphatase [Niabella yanshanensis]